MGKWGTIGTGEGQFNGPNGITVDASGNVYVTEYANHRVQKFTSSGTFLTMWGTQGSGDGQFNQPYGVAVDSNGRIYVADGNNFRVQVFGDAAVPVHLTTWGAIKATYK